MISLVESKDTNLIMGFMKGRGVLRRCLGVRKLPDDLDGIINQASYLVKNPKNVFLVAYDDSIAKGFVALYPVVGYGWSMHLCLKTVGIKTKKIIKMAFSYISYHLNSNSVVWAYPSWARAVKALSSEFGFKRSPELSSVIKTPEGEDFIFDRLILT